jgi:hypothetical protein
MQWKFSDRLRCVPDRDAGRWSGSLCAAYVGACGLGLDAGCMCVRMCVGTERGMYHVDGSA